MQSMNHFSMINGAPSQYMVHTLPFKKDLDESNMKKEICHCQYCFVALYGVNYEITPVLVV